MKKSIFHEMRELRRFRKLPTAQRSIVFYAESANYFVSFESIIDHLTGEAGRTVAYVTSDPADPVLTTDNPRILPFYISKMATIFFATLKARVMVMTIPDLDVYHLRRSTYPVRYVYVYHSLVSTHMMYGETAFDHYDSILCVGPHQVEEIRKRESGEGLPAKDLIEGGYYRLERVYQRYRAFCAEQVPAADRPVEVLIAPSWGERHVLESCGMELVAVLLESGFRVTVRPHPETVKSQPGLLDGYEKAYGANERFELERNVRSDASMLRSDVLISDLSGIVLEYALGTERPVLFVDVPHKVKNAAYRDLEIEPIELQLRERLGVMLSPDDIAQAAEAVQSLVQRKATYQAELAAIRNETVYAFGTSGQVGAEHILDRVTRRGTSAS
ncbi:MAG: CDP-glycerol--glycerophosphate glycerophosphotransferase [Verrucomicrobiota bacterium]